VQVNGAQWPFMGGRLSLEPTTLRFALAENRNFTLVIDGLDAAQFVSRMEMANISATGVFDGRLPVVFDANGGTSWAVRSPRAGGNVSYVGALTYKDLSFMANYAFQALRSLDYKHMTIALRGDIAGDFVTQVQFGGVSQGRGQPQLLHPPDRGPADPVQPQRAGAVLQPAGHLQVDVRSLGGRRSAHRRAARCQGPRGASPRPLCPPRRASPPFSLQQVEPCHEPLNALPLLTVHTVLQRLPAARADRAGRRGWGRHAGGHLAARALSGCISVKAPDKPIVIELNINIKQEVVYRLAGDASQTIDKNKDIF
jgi:hypothetical protein